MKKNLSQLIMTKQDKEQILQSYKQQFEALCQQRNFATDMVEEFARRISGTEVFTPNFFSVGIVDDMAKACRQFLKFYELRERCLSDIGAISSEIDIIKEMK